MTDAQCYIVGNGVIHVSNCFTWPPAWLSTPSPATPPATSDPIPPADAANEPQANEPQATAPPADTAIAPAPAAVPRCRKCGSTEFRDVPIHDGRSVRRDCAKCGRFLAFPLWHGVPQQTGQLAQPSDPAAGGDRGRGQPGREAGQ